MSLYCAFLASVALIKQIPRLLGRVLNNAGKFPALLQLNEKMDDSRIPAEEGCVPRRRRRPRRADRAGDFGQH